MANSTADTHAANLTSAVDRTPTAKITSSAIIGGGEQPPWDEQCTLAGRHYFADARHFTIAANDNVTVSSTTPTIISGNQKATVLTVSPGATMTVDNAVIEDGQAAQGGGIFNAGSLTLSSTTITTNLALGGNGTASTTVNGGNGDVDKGLQRCYRNAHAEQHGRREQYGPGWQRCQRRQRRPVKGGIYLLAALLAWSS